LFLLFSLALSLPIWADEAGDAVKALQKNAALSGLTLTLVKNGDGSLTGKLGNTPVTAFKIDKNWHLAILAPVVNLKKFSKQLEGSPLTDMTLETPGIIIAGAALTASPEKVDNTAVRTALTNVYGTKPIDLKNGVNLFAKVAAGAAGQWDRLKKNLGLGSIALVIQGTLGTDFLKKYVDGKAEKGNGEVKDFDLTIQIPELKPVFAPDPLKFKGGTLTFGMVTEDKTQTFGMTVEAENELTILKKVFSFTSLITYAKVQNSLEFDVSFESTLVRDASWATPGGANFSLQDIGFFAEMGRGLVIPTIALGMKARAAIKDGPTVGVAGTLTMYGKTFDDFTLTITDPIKLGDLPGVKDLEGIKNLTFQDIAVSLNGFSGTVIWNAKKGIKTSFMLHTPRKDPLDVTLLLKMGTIDLQKLFPKCQMPLELPNTYIIISRNGIMNTRLEDLAVNLGVFLSDLTEDPTFTINFHKGVTIAASIDVAKAPSVLKKALETAGLSGPLVIAGSITDLFGNLPSFSLTVQLPQFSFPEKLKTCKFFKPQTAGFEFFINLTNGLELAFGIGFKFGFNLCGDELVLRGRTGTELSVSGVGVKVAGFLDGVWNNAFGLPGLTVQDLVVGYALDADAAIGVKCAGKVSLADQSYSIKFGTKLLPEALGFPKEIAIDFEGTSLKSAPFGIHFQIAEFLFKGVATNPELKNKILNAISDPKKKAKAQEALEKIGKGTGKFFELFSLAQMPFPELRDCRLRLVTPGASDADLKVSGPGMGMKGVLVYFGKDLARIDSYLELTGMKVFGEVLLKKFGPLDIKDAKIDIAANLFEAPHFYITFKIDLIGIKPTCTVTIDKSGMSFSLIIDMNELFYADIIGKTVGQDFAAVKDFLLSAQVKSDFSKWIEVQILEKIQKWEYDDEFKEALDDLQKAKNEVSKLEAEVDRQRLIVLRDREKVLQSAEKAMEKVKEFEEKIKQKKSDLKKLPKWRIFKRAKLAFEIAGLFIAKEACEVYAKAVEECMEAIPIDADPRVWGVITALKASLVGLHAAEEIVEAGNDITDELKDLGIKIAKGLAKFDFFVINNAQLHGSIMALAGRRPFQLVVDATVCDEKVRLDLEFDWKDVKQTAKNIVKECVSQLRRSFTKNRSKKTKHFSVQTDDYDNLDDAKPLAELFKLMKPEFRAQMLARRFVRKEFFLVNRYARLVVGESSGKAVLGSSFLSNSTWKMGLTSDGYFTLTSGAGKNLMVTTAAKPEVTIDTTTNLAAKEWCLETFGKTFRLKNRLSGLVLGIPGMIQKSLGSAPFAGHPVEMQKPGSIGQIPVMGAMAKGNSLAQGKTMAAYDSLKNILCQGWDLIVTPDVQSGSLKHAGENFLVTGANGTLGPVKTKDANTTWELFPYDNDPLSPYVLVRHAQSGKVIRTAPFDAKALMAAIKKNDFPGMAKAQQPAFAFMNLDDPKDAIWRMVRVGDKIALISVSTGYALCFGAGSFCQAVFPTDAKANIHLWTLEKK
jgi:hypothetical protein